MRKQDGKFVLFDIPEFAVWLASTSFTRVISILQVHHTFQPDYSTFNRVNDHFALLKNMERFHMIDRGFSEIAQNLTTFPDGLVAICRSFDTIPAGIKGANQRGLCVENLGNFDADQDVMTPQQQDCILKLYAHLCRRFSLPADSNSIQYHHWWDLNTGLRTNGSGTTKTCPGTKFFSGNSVTDAETGFIPLVSRELAALASATAPVASKASYAAEVAVDSLNVRALPSMSGMVLKQLSRGVEVNIYEDRDGWSRIDPATSSWVNSHFLQTAAGPVKVPAIYSAQVVPPLLNVRSDPSLSGKVMNQLSSGATVYVYEERDGWSRIDANNSLWVNASYLGPHALAASV